MKHISLMTKIYVTDYCMYFYLIVLFLLEATLTYPLCSYWGIWQNTYHSMFACLQLPLLQPPSSSIPFHSALSQPSFSKLPWVYLFPSSPLVSIVMLSFCCHFFLFSKCVQYTSIFFLLWFILFS